MKARDYFQSLCVLYAAQEQRLNALDAKTGDGDHGSTMLRGLKAAVEADDGRQSKAFMRAAGGASGTLFGLVLHEFELHLMGDGFSMAKHLDRALARIKQLGKAEEGDKTMVDALQPAAKALAQGGSIEDAVAAAERGRDATTGMAARSGRAKYVEHGGAGHVDPGATSVCLMLAALAVDEEQR
ncbi:MAG: DAK2 domain-containing protein [Pseudomonadota bacterium]